MTCTHKKLKLFLLVTVFLLGLLPLGGLAQQDTFRLSAQYMDAALGIPQLVEAEPIPYEGYEDSYWLQLPQGVSLEQASFFVQDLSGQYPMFSVQNGTPLSDLVMDAGNDLSMALPLEIEAYTADGQLGKILRLYVSTSSALPALPSAPVNPVNVIIHYQDADSYIPVASDTWQEVPEGRHEVYPSPYDLPANYELTGATYHVVTVSQNGADFPEITFLYRYVKPEVHPVSVTLHYVDAATFAPVASDTYQEVAEGTHDVYPAPYDLQPNYELTGNAYYSVSVNELGADMPELIFYYNYVKPPVQPVNVVIHYQDAATFAPIATDTYQEVPEGSHDVYPAAYDLLPNYELTGNAYYTVTVTENGADMPEITFLYNYVKPPVQPVNVVIHYQDAATFAPVATDTWQEVPEGSHDVYPAAYDLLPNYELTGNAYYTVTVTENGADMPEVTFLYNYVKPPVQPVNVVIHYQDAATFAPIATDTWQEVPEGSHDVYPAAYDLQDNYELTGNAYYTVTVSENGADMPEVTFLYNYVKPPVQPVNVVIHYQDAATFAPIATDTYQEVPEGSHDVYPAAYDLQDNYELTGNAYYTVTVSENGADMPEVTFFYNYVKPAPTAVTLPVLYLDLETGMPVATEGSVTCNPGTVTDVYPSPADLLPGYALSSQSTPLQQVHVDQDGYANIMEVVYYYTLVPATPAPIVPQEVTVSYVSLDGVQIADATVQLCQPGINTIYPNQPSIGSEWLLDGEGYVLVSLDDNGLNPSQVVFYYRPPVQPVATTAPMPVTIRYVDKNGNNLQPEEKVYLPAGDHPITAPDTLNDAYILDGDTTRIVHVDEFGANPSVVTFTYRDSKAAPKVALVTVKYVEVATGSTFYSTSAVCTNENENLVSVDWETLRQMGSDMYLLQSSETVTVTVDDNGVATPAEVVFQFLQPAAATQSPTETPAPTPLPTPELQVNVRVFFQTADGLNVAPYQEVPCFVGNNTIEASPVNLLPNFVLQGEPYQTVTLSPEGQLTPNAVVFTYVSTITPQPPTASPFPYEYTEVDLWCRPTSDSINFRSEPSTAGGNKTVIRKVTRKDIGHITRLVDNGDGEEWYMVEIDGVQGFLSKTVVNMLTEQEIANHLGYTPAPATPSPSPIPENMPIDRWGKTNAKVYFRSSMEKTNSNKLGEPKAGTNVWVYKLDSMEGEQWYAVQLNGQDGYIMAQFVDLYSMEESNALQGTLPSPVPTTSPEPTLFVPTPEPTFTPEPTQVPTPEPTATPLPYTGYALTRYQVPLRTGATDDAILEWLPTDSLVYVNNQTYVTSTSWSYVANMTSQNYGFILTDALLPITNEQAQPYLDMIQQARQTATPVPAQQTGYAMTMGEGVPLRSVADTNGAIAQLLPYMAVANVRGQVHQGNTTWHLVHYNGMWGYVRADQMRMMTETEVAAYLQSLEKSTPLPTEAPATPAPITQESLSSYGHVISNSGKVNLRAKPSTNGNRLRLLDNYAFALVLGTETGEDGTTWYHVSQAGTEGYIQGDYFKVLTLSELSLFLQSNEYKNANTQNSTSGSTTSGQLQPVEDYNQNVWQNPALTHTYAPFVPPTATPDPERLPTATPIPTPIPTSIIPSTAAPSFAPIQGGTTPNPDQVKETGSALPWVLLGLGIAGGGGALYAYSLHKQNERRRQAVRAQQARQAAARSKAAQPQMRMAPGQVTQQTRAYGSTAAPFMPNGSGAPTAQSTTAYKPVSQQTGAYKPVQPQGTQAYAPVSQQTGAYKPVQPQGTQAYAPVSQQTGSFKPVQPQSTQAYTPQAPEAPAPVNPTEGYTNLSDFSAQKAQNTPRRRRSDKYDS